MKEFEVTLTAVSKKTFKLRADSHEDAFLLAEAILENSDLLNFSDEDVDSMDMTCEEQCGGVCDICSRACENCGDCTDLEPDCPYPDRECEHRCPACGTTPSIRWRRYASRERPLRRTFLSSASASLRFSQN